MAQQRHLVQPFPPLVDKRSRVLILGSFPSVRAITRGYYYGNPHNRFYALLGHLLAIDLVTPGWEEKKRLILDRGIAIYDVVASCSINGSNDASISDVVPADLSGLLKDKSIKHIFLNGKIAGRMFDRYFPNYRLLRTILPSTSPANAAMTLPQLAERWAIITTFLDAKTI